MEFPLLHAFSDWCEDSAKISDKSSVERCKSMEATYLADILWSKPIPDGSDLFFVDLNSISTYNKTQK